MKMTVRHTCIVILAAGRSARLGRPKQLLPMGSERLLTYSVRVATEAGLGPVLVITGSEHDAMMATLTGGNAQVVYNPGWEEGIAASIRCGVKAAASQEPAPDGILLMACDQPFVTSDLLKNLLLLQQERETPIAATSYAGTTGIPALFHRYVYPDLLELKGDAGAKKLIATYADRVATLPFPEASIDIDTESDYQVWIETMSRETK